MGSSKIYRKKAYTEVSLQLPEGYSSDFVLRVSVFELLSDFGLRAFGFLPSFVIGHF